MQLPKLNFKEDFVFDIKKDKDTFFIYDIVRKSWLVLTPEEWVRQHFVHYFIKVKKYAPSALILEKKLEVNGTLKRIDLLITEKLLVFGGISIVLLWSPDWLRFRSFPSVSIETKVSSIFRLMIAFPDF